LIGLPAAYVLARQRGLISKVGLGWILLSQMFPLILIVIPLFLVLKDLHLVNTHAGLVLVYVVWTLPFALWMLQSYVRGIPKELEEAALVDGASRLTVLRTVIVPLLAPGIVVTALFAFVTAWNEFFFALVLLDSPNKVTLPLRLVQFVGIEGIVRLGPLAASALVATLPSLVIFAVIQRWLTRGLMSGAVKG
jgi:multiple sugar transport system permease protein